MHERRIYHSAIATHNIRYVFISKEEPSQSFIKPIATLVGGTKFLEYEGATQSLYEEEKKNI